MIIWKQTPRQVADLTLLSGFERPKFIIRKVSIKYLGYSVLSESDVFFEISHENPDTNYADYFS